jgi:hypothetical protein
LKRKLYSTWAKADVGVGVGAGVCWAMADARRHRERESARRTSDRIMVDDCIPGPRDVVYDLAEGWIYRVDLTDWMLE